MRNKESEEEKAERENMMGRKPNPEGPRVMDTMSDMAVGRAMRQAQERGNWDEVKAALEAPLKTATDIEPEPSQAKTVEPGAGSDQDEAAMIMAERAAREARDKAFDHDPSHDIGD